MSDETNVNLPALWKFTTDQVKAKIIRPSLWRALEAACPVALEGDLLVLGFRPEHAIHAGQLADAQTRQFIERVLEAAVRRRVTLRVIDGHTLEDWQITKQQDEAAAALRQKVVVKRVQHSEDEGSWDGVSERLVRLYSTYPLRALPSMQGRYLSEAVSVIATAYGRLMPAQPSEQDQRAYSRMLDRVAERAAVPSALIGYLVHERLKNSG